MEQKKSIKADLERKRPLWFLVGLAMALLLLFAALEFPVRDTSNDVNDSNVDNIMQEMALMQAPDRNDMIAAVDLHPHKAQTQKIKVVDIQKSLENMADISERRTVGEVGGSVEATQGVESKSDDASNSTAPVAVDMGDNPLNFRVVEQLPEFPGGMSAFVKWLTDNLRYPVMAQRQNIQGRVVVSFIINKDGTTSDLKIAKSVHPMLDREALRVARMMPRWKPGIANNRPCRTMFAIPIEFKI